MLAANPPTESRQQRPSLLQKCFMHEAVRLRTHD